MIALARRIVTHPAVTGSTLGIIIALVVGGLVIDPGTTLITLRNVFLGSLLISFVVGFHEFSHLVTARLLGLHVQEFSIGFGYRLTGFRAGGINWNLRALPLGGFVHLHGENRDEGAGSFFTAPAWKKLLTFGAGPISNLFLAWLLLAILGAVHFGVAPLEAAGLSLYAMQVVWDATLYLISSGFGTAIATGDINAIPVGSIPQMMVASGAAVDSGLFNILLMAGLLSLTTGAMNILPIPPMDGGQMLLVSLKALLGRFYPDRLLYRASLACLVFLTALGLAFIGLDLVRILSGGLSVSGL